MILRARSRGYIKSLPRGAWTGAIRRLFFFAAFALPLASSAGLWPVLAEPAVDPLPEQALLKADSWRVREDCLLHFETAASGWQATCSGQPPRLALSALQPLRGAWSGRWHSAGMQRTFAVRVWRAGTTLYIRIFEDYAFYDLKAEIIAGPAPRGAQ